MRRSASAVVFLLAATVAVWAYGQQKSSTVVGSDAGVESDGADLRFAITLVGKESAILLDTRTGDSWYLRAGRNGSVWLSLPKVNIEEREQWLQDEAEATGQRSNRKSDLGP